MTEPELIPRPTEAIIDLTNLTYNFKSIRSFLGGGTLFMAVLKADAYGHGAPQCAKRLEHEGVDWFAVALLEEAVALRNAGIKKPILCLGGVWPGQESAFIRHNVTPAVFELDQARRMSRAAEGATVRIHVKVDTGMGRVGVPTGETADFASQLRNISNLHVEGLMSHLAAADDLTESEFTAGQLRNLAIALEQFRNAGFEPAIVDMANSPGAVAFPDSRANLVRIGGLLYGLGGDVLPKGIPQPDLRPVMTLRTRIAQIKNVPRDTTLGYGRTFRTTRDSVIGTLPIGYHDGYKRALSGKGSAIVNGDRVPIVGRVSMDWTIVDLTDCPNPGVGDTVTLIGSNGGTSIRAEDLAAAVGTISYEITCGISARVPRIYKRPEGSAPA